MTNFAQLASDYRQAVLGRERLTALVAFLSIHLLRTFTPHFRGVDYLEDLLILVCVWPFILYAKRRFQIDIANLYRKAIGRQERFTAIAAFLAIHVVRTNHLVFGVWDLKRDLTVLVSLWPAILLLKERLFSASDARMAGGKGTLLAIFANRKPDPMLLLALAFAVVFSIHGVGWGRFECWNRDEMGLRYIQLFAEPSDFGRPPGYTYLNRCAVIIPVDFVQDAVTATLGESAARKVPFNTIRLYLSRAFVIFLYCITLTLAYHYCLTCYGRFAARVVALFFGCSAGLIEYNHFLSVDSPLLFGMMLAMFLSLRAQISGRLRHYLMAGFAIGAAFNIKYNGLAVGIALVTGHILSHHNRTWQSRVFSKKLIASLAMVPVSMVALDPYMLLDFRKFLADFMYASIVTPRYDGQAEGLGYLKFCGQFPEILGIPGATLLVLLASASLIIILWRRSWFETNTAGFLMASSVFCLYFAKIGAFPRIETRFVLPCIPFFLLMTGPALALIGEKFQRGFGILLTPVLLYSCVCSYLVGSRFNADPRLPALDWMDAHVHPGCRIESSAGSPHWHKNEALGIAEIFAMDKRPMLPVKADAIDLRLPHCNGRTQLFSKVFSKNRWVDGLVASHEGNSDESFFTAAALRERNPDIVTVDASDYKVPSDTVQSFFADLFAGKFPYRVVYDQSTPADLAWVYPKQIDFLRTRCVILAKKN